MEHTCIRPKNDQWYLKLKWQTFLTVVYYKLFFVLSDIASLFLLWEKHSMMLQRMAVYETIILFDSGFLVYQPLPPSSPSHSTPNKSPLNIL